MCFIADRPKTSEGLGSSANLLFINTPTKPRRQRSLSHVVNFVKLHFTNWRGGNGFNNYPESVIVVLNPITALRLFATVFRDPLVSR